MRRILVLLAAVPALLVAAAPAAAAEASWKGVVVAKDNGRSAVITASTNGVVRTVRSPRAGGLRIGQRVTVGATRLADGTYQAATLRVSGRAKSARLKAVVVRDRKADRRLLVSAGGSTFALPRRSGARTLSSAAATSAPLGAGDQIVATVTVSSGVAQATSVSTVGHLGTLEVEGVLTKLEGGSIELVVARAGFVSFALPAGFTLPAGLKVFDPVTAIVAVGSDGKLTLVAIQGDEAKDRDDDGVDFDEQARKLKVEGTITALSPTSITVQPGAKASAVTCTLSRPLTAFAIGNSVEIECVAAASGTLVLRKIKLEADDDDDDSDDDSDDHDDDSEDSDDSDDSDD